jgi:hypothetical protein
MNGLVKEYFWAAIASERRLVSPFTEENTNLVLLGHEMLLRVVENTSRS